MQMCPNCDEVYDESEYSRCPYCSGEIEKNMSGTKIKDCPECSNCDYTIDTDEDDYDGILED